MISAFNIAKKKSIQPLLCLSIKYAYLKEKLIYEIKEQYPENTILNKIKISLKIAKLLCLWGYRDAKIDVSKFRQILKIKVEDRTLQEQKEYHRIKFDIITAIPAFAILFAPFGSPFFFLYLQLFPNLTPTWVLTEKIYNRLQNILKDNRLMAFHYFSKKYSTTNKQTLSKLIAQQYQKITQQNGSVQFQEYSKNNSIRMISNIFFGCYRDGTFYLTHYSPLRLWGFKLNYLGVNKISSWLMQNKIQNQIVNCSYYSKQYNIIDNKEDKLKFLISKSMIQI